MMRYWLLRGHASVTWNERLCLRVEGMSIEATRNWVLTFWVGRIGGAWELSIGVWNWRWTMYRPARLVGAVIKILPRLRLLLLGLHGRAIGSDWRAMWLILRRAESWILISCVSFLCLKLLQ
jgi:hypothetical protein